MVEEKAFNSIVLTEVPFKVSTQTERVPLQKISLKVISSMTYKIFKIEETPVCSNVKIGKSIFHS